MHTHEKAEQKAQVMGSTTGKLDCVVIVGHGTGEVHISPPIYLADRFGRRMCSELGASLGGRGLAGMCGAVSEANKHFCRTTLKSHIENQLRHPPSVKTSSLIGKVE